MKPEVTAPLTPARPERKSASKARRPHAVTALRSHSTASGPSVCRMCERTITKPDTPHACFYYE